jgi:thioredoxin-like negative regulator of GroEL
MSLKFIVSVSDNTSWQNVVVNAPPTTLCVVDVFTEWCGPCTALDHKLQQLHVDLVGCDIKVSFISAAVLAASLAVVC